MNIKTCCFILRALFIGGGFVYDASEQKIIGVFDINNNDKVFSISFLFNVSYEILDHHHLGESVCNIYDINIQEKILLDTCHLTYFLIIVIVVFNIILCKLVAGSMIFITQAATSFLVILSILFAQ